MELTTEEWEAIAEARIAICEEREMSLEIDALLIEKDDLSKRLEKANEEIVKWRKLLRDLIESLEAVHDDPEYQTVWTLYQSHIPTGYRGRKYTKEFDAAKEALGPNKELNDPEFRRDYEQWLDDLEVKYAIP